VFKSRRHKLGQHFLTSREYLARIVAAADPQPSETVVEIGPGKGALTLPLAARAGRVIAIEKDARLAGRLASIVPANVEIVLGDALTFDYKKLKKEADPNGLKLTGNLPYSISSPLAFLILSDPATFRECILLVQKEVAERITAGPGSRKYAPVSILTQIHYLARVLFKIPPGAFSPPPAVDSALLAFSRLNQPLFEVQEEPRFAAFLKEAFAGRRKKLWNNLTRSYAASILSESFKEADIPRDARAEKLRIAQFVKLYRSLSGTGGPIVL